MPRSCWGTSWSCHRSPGLQRWELMHSSDAARHTQQWCSKTCTAVMQEDMHNSDAARHAQQWCSETYTAVMQRDMHSSDAGRHTQQCLKDLPKAVYSIAEKHQKSVWTLCCMMENALSWMMENALLVLWWKMLLVLWWKTLLVVWWKMLLVLWWKMLLSFMMKKAVLTQNFGMAHECDPAVLNTEIFIALWDRGIFRHNNIILIIINSYKALFFNQCCTNILWQKTH